MLTNGEILVMIRRVVAPISILGSCSIMYMILARKMKKKGSYHRFLMGISITDICFTVAFLFGLLPLPEGLVEGAQGNMATCETRAFMVQWFGTLGPFYNVCLELYYVALIRYKMKEADFARKYELWMHITINVAALAMAATGLVADVYNPSIGQVTGCYINSYPPGCLSDDATVECTRGANARKFFLWLGILPYYVVLMLLYGSIGVILWTVLRKDCQTRAFQQRNEPSIHTDRNRQPSAVSIAAPRRARPVVLSITRTVTVQSLLYGVFFSLTYFAFTVFRSIIYFDQLARSNMNLFPLSVVNSIFLPLQGARHIVLRFCSRVFYFMLTFRYLFSRPIQLHCILSSQVHTDTKGPPDDELVVGLPNDCQWLHGPRSSAKKSGRSQCFAVFSPCGG